MNTTVKHISFRMILHLSVASLSYKRARTFVTILGVVIGVGAVYLLLSIGIGLQQLVQNQIVGNQSINTIDVTSSNSTVLKLDHTALATISSIQHVKQASGVFAEAARVEHNGSSIDLVGYGVDRLYFDLGDFDLSTGELFNPNQDSSGAVVNTAVVEAIGLKNPRDAVGRDISFILTQDNGKTYHTTLRITGVVDSSDSAEVFASSNVFEAAHFSLYSSIKVLADDRNNIPTIRKSIESLGYDTASPLDTITQINDVFRFFNLVLIALGSVGMIIAILGMFNTLTVSLLERTREIALMMIIGSRSQDIKWLFITESVILSLAGGVIGMILASGVGLGVNFILNQMAHTRGVTENFSVFIISPLIIISLLALMVAIGVLVSLGPALRAARINPVNALREE